MIFNNIIKNFMTNNLITFLPKTPIEVAVGTFLKNKISGTPIINENNTLIGMISEKDCMRTLMEYSYHNDLGCLVEYYMSKNLQKINIHNTISEVADKFSQSRFRRFPLMDGNWIPEGLFTMMPPYLNVFENTITVQFDHRVLALSTAALVVLFWTATRYYKIPPSAGLAIHCLLLAVIAQVGLGITTLLLVVPLKYAAAHQGGAVLLLICAVWLLRELTPPSKQV